MVSIVHAARDIGRLRAISQVLVRHGFGEIVRRIGLGRPKKAKDSAPPSARGERAIDDSEEESRGDRERREISSEVRARLVLEDLGHRSSRGSDRIDPAERCCRRTDSAANKLLDSSAARSPYRSSKEQNRALVGVDLAECSALRRGKPSAAASIAQVAPRLRYRRGRATRGGVRFSVPHRRNLARRPLPAPRVRALIERAIPKASHSRWGWFAVRSCGYQRADFTAEAENAARFAQNFVHTQTCDSRPLQAGLSQHVLTSSSLDGCKV